MSRLFPWISSSSDKNKQDNRTGKTPERAADALLEASAMARSGDIKAASKLFEESIRIYHSLGLKPDEAEANHAFALALARASEYTAAFEAYSAAIALFRAVALKAELASALRDAGQAYADYSDSEQAAALLDESLTLCTSLGDERGIANTLKAMGRAAYIDESYKKAALHFDQSLGLYIKLEQSDQAALCLAYLSSIAVEQEDFEASREHYIASIDQYRSTLSASPLADTLADLGEAPFTNSSASHVTELLNAAIAVYSHARAPVANAPPTPGMEPAADQALSSNPVPYGSDSESALRAESSACMILAPVAYSQDHSELAETLFNRSMAIANEVSDANLLCDSLLQAGRISSRYNDLAAARRYYTLLNDTADSNEQEEYKAPALYALADADYQARNIEAALRNCEACLELYKSAGNVSAVSHVLMLYGVLQFKLGDSETGLKLLNESLSLCRHCGDMAGVGSALQCIGAEAREIDPVYARACLHECLESEDANEWRVATAMQSLAELDLLQGEIGSAFECCTKALSIRKGLNDHFGVAAALELCAHIAAEWGDIETAVILLSRSEALVTKLGTPRQPAEQERYEANLEKLKSEMGADDFEKAWTEGTTLTLDEITDEIELMLEEVEPDDEGDEIDEEEYEDDEE